MQTPEVIILGGPNSGKTHYGGQLYGRLQHRECRLTLQRDNRAPEKLTAFEDVLDCLNNGRAASRTQRTTYEEVELPLVDPGGRPLTLRWPDYGGEQLRAVFKRRAVDEQWRDRLLSAEGWILLIRLSAQKTYPADLSELLDRQQPEGANPRATEDGWDDNARLVELLQILLHVSKRGVVERRRHPKLAVLLSCFDEVPHQDQTPSLVLEERMPLVSSFLQANWAPDALSVWGLSSLGKLLKQSSQDDDFQDEGPEFQGWVVPPGSTEKIDDLTLPLAWLLERL